MSDTRFTEDHEWARLEEDGSVTVGISNYAQEQLGDVVYVELPDVGKIINAGAEAAVIESVKAAGDVKLPVTGKVIEINERLADEPELVNSSPQDEGWFLKLEPENAQAITNLMDESAYGEYIDNL
ncbi:MAG: glycine cleavage system protein GcvH [Gammaproteobacteria bacterium]|nr:glycine cleavage system protein GcvH [Gammaproteobacteria bacterium]